MTTLFPRKSETKGGCSWRVTCSIGEELTSWIRWNTLLPMLRRRQKYLPDAKLYATYVSWDESHKVYQTRISFCGLQCRHGKGRQSLCFPQVAFYSRPSTSKTTTFHSGPHEILFFKTVCCYCWFLTCWEPGNFPSWSCTLLLAVSELPFPKPAVLSLHRVAMETYCQRQRRTPLSSFTLKSHWFPWADFTQRELLAVSWFTNIRRLCRLAFIPFNFFVLIFFALLHCLFQICFSRQDQAIFSSIINSFQSPSLT